MKTLRIATRKSPLALWQAYYVRDALLSSHADLKIELVEMSTQGDKILDTPLAKIGGKGLFVKELEVAMQRGEADIAVHSMKDVPMELPHGFCLPVICERASPDDAFVSNHYSDWQSLPAGAKVGSSSLRRQCQLKALRPDIELLDLRGNVGTRLGKLDQGDYDAIILAAAGLHRLQLEERIAQYLPHAASLPACGQGAVGIECRSDDTETQALLAPLLHRHTWLTVNAERAMNRHLGGGCQVPIGGHATLTNNQLTLTGLVGHVDGQTLLRVEHTSELNLEDHALSTNQAQALGIQVAETLTSLGADKILSTLHAQQ